ncbi:MAG: MGMT family protein, partial [Clostridia bacterium]
MNFYEKVYEIVRQIPLGKVATYGQIAMLAESPRASRAVGFALHKNPDPSTIPCHRVVNKQGKLAEAFVFGGINEQRIRL